MPSRHDSRAGLLPPRLAAEQLGVSMTTLRRWRHQNRLVKGVHYVQFGSHTIRYDADWLSKFICTGGRGAHKLEVLQALRERR